MSVKLGEIAVSQTGPFGSQLHEEDYVDEGTPIVTVEHLGELGFTRQNLPFVSDEDVRRLSKYTLREGDIVFSRVGAIDRNTYVTEDENGWMFSGRCIRVRCNKDKVNPLYLSYYFRLEHFKRMMLNVSVGATMPSLNTDIMDSLPIDMAERSEQDRIAKCLSLIDDKIRNNNAICSNLEAMAKLLYDYWFVQFDFPDENGKPYKASGGKMVWNDELKREIPAGWEAKPLSAFIAESKNGDWGNNKPKRKDDIEVTCFRGADFASITDDYHVTAPIRYISANNSDRLLSDGDLITEISGGSPTQATGRVGYINQKFLDRNGGKMDCSNFCKAFTPMECFYQYWLYQTWKAFYDAGVMFNYESKTTGIKNLMFDEFITWVRVPAPSDELLKKYQEVCSQYYDKIQEEFIESTQLASLRDFLLPMLMNGQVKVGA